MREGLDEGKGRRHLEGSKEVSENAIQRFWHLELQVIRCEEQRRSTKQVEGGIEGSPEFAFRELLEHLVIVLPRATG